MHRLVIASQKGGSGKTTLSGHLAVEAEKAGAGPVALIDTDPQGSLTAWWNAREAATPIFVKVGSLELEDALTELHRSGVQLVVIDTPPAITTAMSKVIACADLVIVPTRPSPHDLRSVGATVDVAEHYNKPLIFVVNAATARARITSDSAIALSQHGTVAPVTIHHRVDFASSMVDGRTAGEVQTKSKSGTEISALWEYVAGRLERLQSRSRLSQAMPALDAWPQLVARNDDSETDEINAETAEETAETDEANTETVEANTETAEETAETDEANTETVEAWMFPDRIGAATPPAVEQIAESELLECRSGKDRRSNRPSQGNFGGAERRSAHPFGRRRTDRAG